MTELTPQQAAAALDAVERALPDALRDVLGFGAVRIGANAVGRMRDAKGEGRRRSGDTGPLRIVTGTLARAVNDKPGSINTEGGINRISTEGAHVILEKGVDLGVVPYARVHEKGFHGSRVKDGATIKIPARPYLEPALAAEEPAVRRFAEDRLAEMLRDAVGSR